MGVPDLATRALVHRLRTTLDLPVYGLVDWNSWGVGVLLCYKLGSARLGVESHRYTVDVSWLGLRSSQVARFRVPDVCMQALTPRDRRRGECLLEHPYVAARPPWRAEQCETQRPCGPGPVLHRRGARGAAPRGQEVRARGAQPRADRRLRARRPRVPQRLPFRGGGDSRAGLAPVRGFWTS
mmetsp:Transcript_33742/g.101909  ORF Transcript_33742/g.101909 Transcript_33742/m.101909 type:complete len:182 (-) Transcript_33742:27-572(-)